MKSREFVLLDRDGTIIYDRHYLADEAGVELLPNAAAGLRRLIALGYKLIVVTNQSGIARRYFDEATLARIHARLRELLAVEGVSLTAIYHCPHDDTADCDCRKPRPGMANRAATEHGFDPRSAIVIGDKAADIGLAQGIGATGVLVRTGSGAETEREAECRPDHIAADLLDAAKWLEKPYRATAD